MSDTKDGPEGSPEGSLDQEEIKKQEAREQVARGRRAIFEGDSHVALRYFNAACILDPDNPDAWEGLGDIHFNTNNFAYALLHFKKAVKLDPNRPSIWLQMGLCNLGIFEHGGSRDIFTEGLDCLEKALELDSNCAQAYYLLGVCLAEYKQEDGVGQAVKYLRRFLELVKNDNTQDAIAQKITARRSIRSLVRESHLALVPPNPKGKKRPFLVPQTQPPAKLLLVPKPKEEEPESVDEE